MKLYFIFLRKPVRLNPFLIVRLTPKLWIVSPSPRFLLPAPCFPRSSKQDLVSEAMECL
jgi:hypothetical protein